MPRQPLWHRHGQTLPLCHLIALGFVRAITEPSLPKSGTPARLSLPPIRQASSHPDPSGWEAQAHPGVDMSPRPGICQTYLTLTSVSAVRSRHLILVSRMISFTCFLKAFVCHSKIQRPGDFQIFSRHHSVSSTKLNNSGYKTHIFAAFGLLPLLIEAVANKHIQERHPGQLLETYTRLRWFDSQFYV